MPYSSISSPFPWRPWKCPEKLAQCLHVKTTWGGPLNTLRTSQGKPSTNASRNKLCDSSKSSSSPSKNFKTKHCTRDKIFLFSSFQTTFRIYNKCNLFASHLDENLTCSPKFLVRVVCWYNKSRSYVLIRPEQFSWRRLPQPSLTHSNIFM